MGWVRLSFRLALFSLFLAGTCLLAVGLSIADRLRGTPIDRNPWATLCFRRACQCLGWHIQISGPRPDGHALYAANHISWSDIPVLGSVTPLRFLSKSEVGHWPVIGWLARQAGTLFIKRGGGQARRIKADMCQLLKAGESVMIFPEGTTSDGVAVLPMHGLMLSSARDAGVPIQPVTIGYRRQNRPDALAPFVGDDGFHHHLVKLLKQPPLHIEVLFHPAIDTDRTESMTELTNRLHLTISEGLRRIHAGEFDPDAQCPVRTVDGPELSRLP
ncbi:1-acyl-sn-glycerol-3-phosphate acyltransferase [Marinobacter sp. SS5-14b]|uniref:lysophospholipid acyltransferase family protein n=1 Tax=Marinobacter sp. SS5-14b TaxID=3050456 RepID=UPI0026E02246|nr:lysophospholipid acyltransferase family protein [Marinobacter sp. SS5-14b]